MSKNKLLEGNYFYKFDAEDNGIDPKICDWFLDSAGADFKKATILSKHGEDRPNIRKCQTFFNNEDWVYKIIWPYLHNANQEAQWNFEISACENYQISKYVPGDLYNTHIDGLGTHGDKIISEHENLNDKVRKISMTMLLNDPSEFEGGELLLLNVGAVPQKKGTMTFFPSYLPHEISPVTKGVRYSLVMWFLGYPFQ